MKLTKLLFSAIIIFTLALAGCKNDAKDQGSSDQNFVIRLAQQPERINPILFPAADAREIYQYIFLPLADLNGQSLQFEPIMIKSIPVLNENNGNYSIDVEILEDASWTNGSPVTAEDYLFTLKTIFHPECNTFRYKYIIDIIDDISIDPNNNKKMTIHFGDYSMQMVEAALNFEVLPAYVYDPQGHSKAFNLLDLIDSTKLFALDSAEAFHQFAENFNSQKFSSEIIDGSGPYEFVEWNENESIILQRKADYWGASYDMPAFKARPAQIIFAIIPDEIAALTQLSEGKIDLVNNVSQNGLSLFTDSLKLTPNFYLEKIQQPRYYHLILNLKHPILKDKLVRQALNALHNDKEYIETFEKGEGKDMYSFIPEFLPGHNKSVPETKFEPSQAKTLLQKAGWSDSDGDGILDKVIDGKKYPLSLRFFASGALGVNMALLFKEACKEVGIDIEIVQKEFALIRKENLLPDDFEIIASVASVDLFLENPFDNYHSSNVENSNVANYQSAVADSLINIITTTTNNEVRLKAHGELQQLISEDVVWLYLYSPISRITINNKWKGSSIFTRPGYKANTFQLAQ